MFPIWPVLMLLLMQGNPAQAESTLWMGLLSRAGGYHAPISNEALGSRESGLYQVVIARKSAQVLVLPAPTEAPKRAHEASSDEPFPLSLAWPSDLVRDGPLRA